MGVIVIDEDKFEVKDTYIIGAAGYTRVNGFVPMQVFLCFN
jgi:hypothetical protein